MIRAAVGIYVSGSQSRHQEHRRHIFLRCQETCTTTAVGLYNSRRGSHQRRTYLQRVVAAVFPPADKRHKLHTPSFSATKVEGNEGCLDWVTEFQSMSVAVSRLLARERLAHNDWVDNAGDALWFLPRPGRPSPSPSSLCRCTYGSVPIFYYANSREQGGVDRMSMPDAGCRPEVSPRKFAPKTGSKMGSIFFGPHLRSPSVADSLNTAIPRRTFLGQAPPRSNQPKPAGSAAVSMA